MCAGRRRDNAAYDLEQVRVARAPARSFGASAKARIDLGGALLLRQESGAVATLRELGQPRQIHRPHPGVEALPDHRLPSAEQSERLVRAQRQEVQTTCKHGAPSNQSARFERRVQSPQYGPSSWPA